MQRARAWALVSTLFPCVAGLHPSGIRVAPEGRYVVAPRYGEDGYPDTADAGLVTFAIDEGTTSARPDPTAPVRPHHPVDRP